MDRDLQTSLLRDNLWLRDSSQLPAWLSSHVPDPYVPRLAALAAASHWHEVNRAHLVIGPRQAGKSTALWTYLAERGTPVLFLDCEQALVRAWCRSAPLFLADLETLVTQPVTLFFDEVQHLEEAGLFIKGLVDRSIGVPILVTGSSSYHLGARTRESLAGRATRTRLLPFSLAEISQDLGSKPPAIRERLVGERWVRHLAIGGYPAVWLGADPESLLADLVEAIILRDASDLFRIGRPDAFRRLLRLLATQVGSLVNLSEWSGVLGIGRDTVASYLEILEASHVAATLTPYAGGRRAELTSRPKVYLVDNGIRNRLAHDFKPLAERADAGATLENWVFTELWKALPEDATLHFWRSASGAEVDFVVERAGTVVGIEVKASRLARPALSRSSRSFLDAYRPPLFLVVNTGVTHRAEIAATTIQWVQPPDLAARVAEALVG